MKYEQNRAVGVLVLTVALFGAAAAAQDAAQALSDDQSAVVGCLHTIDTAEVAYSESYKTGFSPTLKALSVPDEGTNYTASAAGLIDASLGRGKRNNYVLTYKPGAADAHEKISTYTVRARPIKWQMGVPSFFTDQTGVVRSTTENRAANANDPNIDK